MRRYPRRISAVCLSLALWGAAAAVYAQRGELSPAGPAAATAPAAAVPEPAKDPLGRDTPKGTVLGFMGSAGRGNNEAASAYLDSTLKGQPLSNLVHQLYAVLDARLPARLNALSDKPQGALVNPLKPDRDVVGTIDTESGPLEIAVERVTRGTAAPVWLFSRATLQAIPAVFEEINRVTIERRLPGWVRSIRIGGIRLFQWLLLFIALPALYTSLGLAGWLARPLVVQWRKRSGTPQSAPIAVPGWLRLLLLTVLIRWGMSMLNLPLLERQFWAMLETLFAIVAAAWLLIRVNAYCEFHISRRFYGTRRGEVAALLRLGRRLADLVVVVVAVIVALRFFGYDPTAALAGLGIGGIAVALAAQKTLENMIGGLSLVFDKAVKVGDFLKLGDTMGTVESVGLRSTRIRTLDRTMLSVPNGQIATANIETFSVRDKYWFHHFIGLTRATTPAQMRTVIESIQIMLTGYPTVDRTSLRVRFLRFSPSALDIEVFAYVAAADYERFLEIQEEFLLKIMEIVERCGTEIALPSQSLLVSEARGAGHPAEAAARLIPSRDGR